MIEFTEREIIEMNAMEENICKIMHHPDVCKVELDKLDIPEGTNITIHMVHMNHLDMI